MDIFSGFEPVCKLPHLFAFAHFNLLARAGIILPSSTKPLEPLEPLGALVFFWSPGVTEPGRLSTRPLDRWYCWGPQRPSSRRPGSYGTRSGPASGAPTSRSKSTPSAPTRPGPGLTRPSDHQDPNLIKTLRKRRDAPELQNGGSLLAVGWTPLPLLSSPLLSAPMCPVSGSPGSQPDKM